MVEIGRVRLYGGLAQVRQGFTVGSLEMAKICRSWGLLGSDIGIVAAERGPRLNIRSCCADEIRIKHSSGHSGPLV